MQRDIKEILGELKIGLQKTYQQRLRGLLLFGSYANGTARSESDIDIGLIVDDFKDIGKEVRNASGVASQLSLQNNVVISLHPIRESDWNNRNTPFILNLKREGKNIL